MFYFNEFSELTSFTKICTSPKLVFRYSFPIIRIVKSFSMVYGGSVWLICSWYLILILYYSIQINRVSLSSKLVSSSDFSASRAVAVASSYLMSRYNIIIHRYCACAALRVNVAGRIESVQMGEYVSTQTLVSYSN